MGQILIFFLKLMNNNFFYKIEFYLISNNFINAKFLSRFIGRKFQQHYDIYNLINPIKRELKLVT